MYSGVPTALPAAVRVTPPISFAIPKSISLTSPARVRIRFAGLGSRCMIPTSWIATSPAIIWTAMSRATSAGSAPRLVEQVPDRHSVHVLHRDVLPVAVDAVLVDPADVGGGDLPGETDLAAEPARHLVRGLDVRAQRLQGHGLFEGPVEGLEHDAHASRAQQTPDLEPPADDVARRQRGQRLAAAAAAPGARLVLAAAGRTGHGTSTCEGDR